MFLIIPDPLPTISMTHRPGADLDTLPPRIRRLHLPQKRKLLLSLDKLLSY